MARKKTMHKVMQQLHQRPIAYFPAYADLTGSVKAGLLLSQLMYWWSAKNGDTFDHTDEDLRAETRLSIEELKQAKKRLKQMGFIEITRQGLPARTFYTIDIDALTTALAQLPPSSLGSNQLLGNPPTGIVENTPPSWRETHQPESGFSTNIPYTENIPEIEEENSQRKRMRAREDFFSADGEDDEEKADPFEATESCHDPNAPLPCPHMTQATRALTDILQRPVKPHPSLHRYLHETDLDHVVTVARYCQDAYGPKRDFERLRIGRMFSPTDVHETYAIACMPARDVDESPQWECRYRPRHKPWTAPDGAVLCDECGEHLNDVDGRAFTLPPKAGHALTAPESQVLDSLGTILRQQKNGTEHSP